MKAIVKFNTCFIVSDYSCDTIAKVAKFRPDALTLVKGGGNNDTSEILFAIKAGDNSSISKYGICFSEDSRTGDNSAVYTFVLPEYVVGETAIKEYIRDKLGLAIVYGSKVEAQIATALEAITADEEVMNSTIIIDNSASDNAMPDDDEKLAEDEITVTDESAADNDNMAE